MPFWFRRALPGIFIVLFVINSVALFTEFRSRNLRLNISQLFLDTIYVYLCQNEGLRNWGIEGLKDNINKLKQIEFL
jgi:hypothetical protein